MQAHPQDSPRGHAELPTGSALAIGRVPARLVPLYVLLDIPNAEGGPLRGRLRTMFEPHAAELGPGEELVHDPTGIGPSDYDRVLLILGHLRLLNPLAAPRNLGRRIVYIAAFQDPVARTIGAYDQIRRARGHRLNAELSGRSLREVASDDGPFMRTYANDQLRTAFGTDDPVEAVERLRAGSYIVGRAQQADALLDAVSAVSGLERTNEVLHGAPTGGSAPLDGPVPASAQTDFAHALAVVRTRNAAEIDFIETHLRDVVVALSLAPIYR